MRSLESIKGFGPVRLKALAARGIETALDLLVETLPTGYKDTTRPLSPGADDRGAAGVFHRLCEGQARVALRARHAVGQRDDCGASAARCAACGSTNHG